MIRFVLSSILLFSISALFLVGCTANLSRPPNIGSIGEYPIQIEGNSIQVGMEFPEARHYDEILSGSSFAAYDIIVMNLIIHNSGGDSYFINRNDFLIRFGLGIDLAPLDGSEILDITSNPFSIFFGNQYLETNIRRWSLEPVILLSPGDTKRGYVFYKSSQPISEVFDAQLQITMAKVNFVEFTRITGNLGDE